MHEGAQQVHLLGDSVEAMSLLTDLSSQKRPVTGFEADQAVAVSQSGCCDSDLTCFNRSLYQPINQPSARRGNGYNRYSVQSRNTCSGSAHRCHDFFCSIRHDTLHFYYMKSLVKRALDAATSKSWECVYSVYWAKLTSRQQIMPESFIQQCAVSKLPARTRVSIQPELDLRRKK